MKLSHGTMGLAVGGRLPVVQIETRPPVNDGKPIETDYGPSVADNGLTIYYSDAPALPTEPTIDDCHPICVHCILRAHPTIGRGLKVAERHGCAVFVGGKWQPARKTTT
jgi:hypothetical protein